MRLRWACRRLTPPPPHPSRMTLSYKSLFILEKLNSSLSLHLTRRRRRKKNESSGVCSSAPPSPRTHLQLIAERQIAFALATASHPPQPEVKLNIHRAKEADQGPISPLRRRRRPCSAKCGREASVYPLRWLIHSRAFPGRRSQM